MKKEEVKKELHSFETVRTILETDGEYPLLDTRDLWLYTQEAVIEEQKTWLDCDGFKTFDFTIDDYWIVCPQHVEGFPCIGEALQYFNDL